MSKNTDSKELSIDVLSAEGRTFPPTGETLSNALLDEKTYNEMYKESIDDPEGFWSRQAELMLHWDEKWSKVVEYDFTVPEVKWFLGGRLNASYNCLDRHLDTIGDKTAILWEAEDGSSKKYSYKDLHKEVCKFANVLKSKGVVKGDRVTVYMPMIPELTIAVLACARIGAIHSVVFGGFSVSALRDRIHDCESKLIVTADGGFRGGKTVPLKVNVDESLKADEMCNSVETVISVKRAGCEVKMTDGRDYWWEEEMAKASDDCPPESMDSEDPLFILYTSGSTGKPKGVLHTTGGYSLYAAMTYRYIFDNGYDTKNSDDVYFCTADVGWITGHSYIIYGPLANGATSVMFEGIPTYPDAGRFWDIVAKHKVTIFYTAPTAIRALMKSGTEWVTKHDLSSLRLLGSVGEPINPEAWMWYYDTVGGTAQGGNVEAGGKSGGNVEAGGLPIMDTWWQTETGGILISPMAGVSTLKPGSANKPFFGVCPKVLKEDGTEAGTDEGGYLVIEKPWPGMLRGTYGDVQNKRVKEVYFSRFPGKYFTGDGARIDKDGDYWLMGRIDDVLNVSGHRLGTAEIESALVAHDTVSEAAVVGHPHDVKGEGIYAYVTLYEGIEASEELRKKLETHVRDIISPIAKPDKIQFAPALPKTRSGKIMRRILRKIACGQTDELGDTSTLADPSVVDDLVKNKQ